MYGIVPVDGRKVAGRRGSAQVQDRVDTAPPAEVVVEAAAAAAGEREMTGQGGTPRGAPEGGPPLPRTVRSTAAEVIAAHLAVDSQTSKTEKHAYI